jgi:hypothetical protein
MSTATFVDISAAVGVTPRPNPKKGKEPRNKLADVSIVQELLNAAGVKVKENGKADDKTIEAIKKFQKSKAGFKNPDGVIDPGRKTIKKLNELWQKSKDGKDAAKDAKTNGKDAAKDKPKKKIRVAYTVPLYGQPTGMSCWAAGIAMMVGHKKSMSINIKSIADELGYQKQFKTNGLHPEDTKVFKAWGLRYESPMCYTVEGFADLLRAYGPLWVASKVNAPHIRVVTGIAGDGTADGTMVAINDPAPVGKGSKYKRTYRKFADQMEGLGADELSFKKPIYIAHF